MTNISFNERLKTLFSLVFSSPFFLSVITILILTTLALIFYKKFNNNKVKYIIAFGYFIATVLLLVKYGNSILKLSDTLVDKMFTLIYFPSIISYICIFIVSVLILIKSFVNKKTSMFIKVCNIISVALLSLLFVLSVDTIVSNNIDIFAKTSLYRNETLLILIQASMFIFIIWLLIILINFIVDKILKRIEPDEKEVVSELEETFKIPNELKEPSSMEYHNKININLNKNDIDKVSEPVVLTDEQFKTLFNKFINDNNDYNNIVDNIENEIKNT